MPLPWSPPSALHVPAAPELLLPLPLELDELELLLELELLVPLPLPLLELLELEELDEVELLPTLVVLLLELPPTLDPLPPPGPPPWCPQQLLEPPPPPFAPTTGVSESELKQPVAAIANPSAASACPTRRGAPDYSMKMPCSE